MFDQNKKEISREKLYEQVWTHPLKKVGEMYGVSDNAIRKKCKQFNIPLPDNSYRWKMNVGQNPKRKPLPKREGYNFITFQESNFTMIKSEREDNKTDFGYLDEPLRSKVLKVYNTLQVPEESVKNHRLVTAYIEEKAERERNLKKIRYDLLRDKRKQVPILDIDVADEMLPRVFKIATIILKALEEIGCTIDIPGYSIINIREMQIAFHFKEKSTRVLLEKNEHGYSPSELVPNGRLAFVCCIYEDRRDYYNVTEIVDTNATKLERKINTIFKKIIDLSQVQIDRVAEREEHTRIAALERIEKERLKKIRDNEIRKVKSLLKSFILWEKAENLRSYIDALEANLGDDIGGEEIEYIRWARKKADWIDPTTDKEDDILESVKNEADILKLLIPTDKENTFNRYWRPGQC